jgi:hypothetical protein
LYRHGYDLGRFYSLEEVYAQNLIAYYAALQTHPHHNYYEGRAEADLTGWVAYFLPPPSRQTPGPHVTPPRQDFLACSPHNERHLTQPGSNGASPPR